RHDGGASEQSPHGARNTGHAHRVRIARSASAAERDRGDLRVAARDRRNRGGGHRSMKPAERISVGATERSNGITPATEMKLRRTATQLEGLFVQRMFAAMRETVPQDGIMAQSSAESTFSSLLDEKLAEKAPTQWSGAHSLAEALYRQ